MNDESVTALVMKREALRDAMADCPACDADLPDEISDADLDGWLVSHGVDPETLAPVQRDTHGAAMGVKG